MRKGQYVGTIGKGVTGRFERNQGKSNTSRIETDGLVRHFHELLEQVIIWGKIGLATKTNKHNEN
jgi:hypothetical protein